MQTNMILKNAIIHNMSIERITDVDAGEIIVWKNVIQQGIIVWKLIQTKAVERVVTDNVSY